MSDSNTINLSQGPSASRRVLKGTAVQHETVGGAESMASQTIQAPEQPAAIVSKTLARFSAGERTNHDYRNSSDQSAPAEPEQYGSSRPAPSVGEHLFTQQTGGNTDYIMAQLMTQFQAQAGLVVLAQANQMPNEAMPFSTGA